MHADPCMPGTDLHTDYINTPINITNDILWGMENQEVAMMLILDLSAAFDTVNHSHPAQNTEQIIWLL